MLGKRYITIGSCDATSGRDQKGRAALFRPELSARKIVYKHVNVYINVN
jgi:hypothetical protein